MLSAYGADTSGLSSRETLVKRQILWELINGATSVWIWGKSPEVYLRAQSRPVSCLTFLLTTD